MSRNDDEKKALEPRDAIEPPGKKASESARGAVDKEQRASAAEKGEQIRRALEPASNLDEKELARRRAVSKAFRYGKRDAVEQILREKGVSGPERERLLKLFDELHRIS